MPDQLWHHIGFILLISTGLPPLAVGADQPRIKAPARVSPDGHHLLSADAKPFFYLGDTAWELFHRCNRDDAERYLKDRAAKGFTVVQAVAIAELDGHSVPNSYGHLPLTELDPARPATQEGPNNDYWDHVDWIIEKANSLGLVVGFLPTWGRYWHDPVKDGKPLFNRENAGVYGEWIGRRYRDREIIWILGGDRSISKSEHRLIIEAMALGLKRGDGGAHLVTLHPNGGAGSAQWFHDAPWLDFNMRQNGHSPEFTGRYDKTHEDYLRRPAKPVIDGEPIYEDHPVSFNAKNLGHSIAADVRRPIYWDLLGGACGHTYGHHSIWQMWQAGRKPINDPLMPWHEALDQPGSGQMRYARNLLESRPILSRIPDDTIIVADRVATSVPGAGRYRFAASRDVNGTFAIVYAPVGRPFSVRMEVIKGREIRAWWYDPRNGEASRIGEFPAHGVRRFEPRHPGESSDWVLVLDDAGQNYPPPGKPATGSRNPPKSK